MSQAPTRTTIESLHARAEASYRSGDFEDARAAWQEILSLDPGDERAKEGLKLLALVDPKWAVFEEADRAAAGGADDALREARALLRDGRLDEAASRVAVLRAEHPGDPAVEALARELEAAANLRRQVDDLLARARAALAEGRPDAAAEECRRALALSPGDREAERLLEAAEAASGGEPAAPEPAPDLPLDLELDLAAVAPAPAPEETTGAAPAGHLELENPGDLPSIPLAVPPEPEVSGESAGPSPGPETAPPEPAGAAVPGAAPAGPAEVEDALGDLFEAARELEEEVPAADLAATRAALPPSPPPAEPGEATRLAARAREELERGNTAEATQLAARALALDATLADAEQVLEEARRRDEERARQAEDLVGQAVQAMDRGEPQLAIPLLRQVLELIPGHAEARELLARAEAAEAVLPPAPDPAPGEAPIPVAAPPPPSPPPETVDLPPVDEAALGGPRASAPGPAPGTEETASPETSSSSRGKGAARRRGVRLPVAPRRGLLVAVLVLALAAAGGVGAWRLGLLPLGAGGDTEDAAPAPVRRPARARKKKAPAKPGPAAGSAETARPQESPSPAPGDAKGTATPAPRYTKKDVPRLLREAERALARGDEAGAVELLEAARAADPLDFGLVEKLEAARIRLRERQDAETRLAAAKQAFREGDWTEALRVFYRIPEPYRPPQLDRWIADGWYNLGIRELQAGDVVAARRYFNDCLELAPHDEAARRHREVALRYRGRPLDDAYWIYVRALEPRPLRED